MPEPWQKDVAKAAKLLNGVLEYLDDENLSFVAQASALVEDAAMQWGKMDRKIIRTWLAVAVEDLNRVLRKI